MWVLQDMCQMRLAADKLWQKTIIPALVQYYLAIPNPAPDTWEVPIHSTLNGSVECGRRPKHILARSAFDAYLYTIMPLVNVGSTGIAFDA